VAKSLTYNPIMTAVSPIIIAKAADVRFNEQLLIRGGISLALKPARNYIFPTAVKFKGTLSFLLAFNIHKGSTQSGPFLQ